MVRGPWRSPAAQTTRSQPLPPLVVPCMHVTMRLSANSAPINGFADQLSKANLIFGHPEVHARFTCAVVVVAMAVRRCVCGVCGGVGVGRGGSAHCDGDPPSHSCEPVTRATACMCRAGASAHPATTLHMPTHRAAASRLSHPRRPAQLLGNPAPIAVKLAKLRRVPLQLRAQGKAQPRGRQWHHRCVRTPGLQRQRRRVLATVGVPDSSVGSSPGGDCH